MHPAPPPARPPSPSILRLLFGVEALALDPEPPPRARQAALRALLAAEALPAPPAEAPPGRVRGPGLLRALFAPEALPEAPPEAPRSPRQRWLSWLFGPESLDPPP